MAEAKLEGTDHSVLADVAAGLAELSRTLGDTEAADRNSKAAENASDQWRAVQPLRMESPGEAFPVMHAACDRTYIEQFRLLRTQLLLHRSRVGRDCDFRCVTVMSTLAEEGKTFTAANLAAVLAISSGQRVLLMEADPLGPGFHAQLGMTSNPGLVHALAAPEDWMKCLRQLPGTPLYVMPRGTPNSNVLNQVDFEPLPVLLEVLRSHFEWIVIDGTSFSESPDAQWLAALADGNLLVVRQGLATFNQVNDALRRIPPERLVGVVMNQRKAPRRRWFQFRVKIRRS